MRAEGVLLSGGDRGACMDVGDSRKSERGLLRKSLRKMQVFSINFHQGIILPARGKRVSLQVSFFSIFLSPCTFASELIPQESRHLHRVNTVSDP